ncbi:MAG: (Fe-S)-binding protein [Promethearchaeota archaeon]
MVKLIFLGCLSSSKYSETCKNASKLIKFLDNEYQILENVPCCGGLAYHISSDEDLRNHIQFVNEWFKQNNVSELITICAGCYNYLTHYYTKYLGSDFNVRVQHLLQFINEQENLKKLNLKYTGKKLNIYYHDGCHLRNADVPVIEEARNILNSIEGNIEFKEMENNKINSLCCGAGGGVYSIFKSNSDYNSNLIFKQMKMSKALLTACPFCYTALTRIREENNIKTPVIKFEDFIIKIMEGVESINV